MPPPPARPSDTGYTIASTAPVPPAPPDQGPGGASPRGRDPRRTGIIALAAALGGLLLVLCIGGGVVLVNSLGNGNGKADPTTTASPTAPPASLEAISCERMKGDPIEPVEAHLKKDGFRVKVTEVDDSGRRGTVVDVPCSAPHGSEVEVKVSSGRSSRNEQPTASCTPGFLGGLAPGRDCTPSAPR